MDTGTVVMTNVRLERRGKSGTPTQSPRERTVTKISRLRKPDDMPLEEWRIALFE